MGFLALPGAWIPSVFRVSSNLLPICEVFELMILIYAQHIRLLGMLVGTDLLITLLFKPECILLVFQD